MTLQEVMNSIALKKRFCKDMNLPVTVFDNPYFSQRLLIINPLYECVDAFSRFVDGLGKFENADAYFLHYNGVKQDMIDHITNHPSFKAFVNQDVDKRPPRFKKQNLYTETNDGKTFISIDMKSANFSVLHLWDPSIFNNHESWHDFVGDYTDLEHIKASKYIRQVVLGACSPGKQISTESRHMQWLAQHIAENLPTMRIYSVNVDEILIEYDKPVVDERILLELTDCVRETYLGDCVSINLFSLQRLKGVYGFLKAYQDDSGRVEFKGVNGEIFHQVVLYYYNMEIKPDDLVFYHDTRLARFLEPIPNPWGGDENE